MRNLFQKLSAAIGARPGSKEDAKQRLKLLLIHDQVDLTPGQLDSLKQELMEVISRYVDVDRENVELRLNREDGGVALVTNVPVRRVTGARA